MVADIRKTSAAVFRLDYGLLFMNSLKVIPTVKKHVNTLQHILGYFRKVLTERERQQVLDAIDDYYSGQAPLAAPIGLIRDYAFASNLSYIADQVYLNPYPDGLRLRE